MTGDSLPPKKHLKPDSTPSQSPRPATQIDRDDLWGLAYAQLGAENSSLVKNYERILEEASGGAEDVSI